MLTSFDIAKYFIWAANKAGRSLSNLKLLKLVYYAQGFYLAIYSKPLFSDEILAWDLGPVVTCVYYKYQKEFKIQPDDEIDLSLYDPSVIEILEHVQETLGCFTAKELSDKTHDESPWKDTPRNHRISEDLMMKFFRDNLDKFGFVKQDVSAPVTQKRQTAFEFYLESEDEWSEVYQRLAVS